ncbi:LLM class flavin-dependent oxidoreductase [Micromonospora parathelypteridis]|uniref:Alkanesulfonate monooxygenase SsuD/methylene tetrahydromethanopterin reductase-like flavin-dependent oxidoreductase (Luciferase family) n=1 Tax=Micromonospora parathelypteridis TaxID=1839617 RepID=A0A840VTS1_9ACTN|nr:LLM class flavin-dependent oxidoreductase [Micromonospora parathelypteridis]MBB5475970.1 alkanesulfonate monooxygenase SsuD/methylene tetrahydromethanopterin reductase-like flavin-dependent oxidoreductase (luciferase family) [Micromonospora parathelypteridis]GGO32217.1 putative monooxygenase (luciferase-like) [Micromonospora parathelypteridis]
MSPTPLSILDLSPVPAGGTVTDALRNTVDLARRAEQSGYHRYWLAEHHLAAGVASSAPAVLIGQVAAATSVIRVGSGAVQVGHRTALSVVEEFGTLAALYPGRIDLGLGRSGQRRVEAAREIPAPTAPPVEAQVVDGLLIPPPFSYARVLASPRFALSSNLLHQPGAQPPPFAEQVADVLALLRGDYTDADGLDAHAVPGEGSDVQVWLLGSSGGESAQLAGALGLPFAANYHVSPSSVLDAVAAYRAAFQPSDAFAEPYVVVSADVVVAETDDAARRLAAPYGPWVRSIRSGDGAIPFPSPEQAAALPWTDDDRELVADRVDTQFVGSAATVVDQLRTLQDVTTADELLVTTITHAHADRVTSYELLAKEWNH